MKLEFNPWIVKLTTDDDLICDQFNIDEDNGVAVIDNPYVIVRYADSEGRLTVGLAK